LKKTWVDNPDMGQKGVCVCVCACVCACVCIFTERQRERENIELTESTVSNRLKQPEHFWHVYTPVSLSTRGPVLKLTLMHSSSGKVNGQSEIPDPLKS